MNETDEKTIKRYLLGAMTEAEQEAVEARFLDREFAELCEVIEGELIDDYVFERLPADLRYLFEKNFLISPARIHMLRTIQMVTSFATSRTEIMPIPKQVSRFSSRTFKYLLNWRIAWGFSILIFAVSGFLLFKSYQYSNALERQLEFQTGRQNEIQNELATAESRNDKTQKETELLRHELEVSRTQEQKLRDELSRQSWSSLASVTLVPSLRAAGETPTLKLNRHVHNVRIRFPIKEIAKDVLLQVVVRNQDTKSEILESISPQKAGFAAIMLPSTKLPPGDYVVIVRAKISEGEYQDIDIFQLRVQKR